MVGATGMRAKVTTLLLLLAGVGLVALLATTACIPENRPITTPRNWPGYTGTCPTGFEVDYSELGTVCVPDSEHKYLWREATGGRTCVPILSSMRKKFQRRGFAVETGLGTDARKSRMIMATEASSRHNSYGAKTIPSSSPQDKLKADKGMHPTRPVRPQRTLSFFGRMRKALMTLELWEAYAVAFVIGCGIGSLLRMLHVTVIIVHRSFQTRRDEDVETKNNFADVLPPPYTDERAAIGKGIGSS